MKKCIAVYLRLSLEDVDKRTNQAKDESNSIAAQRQLIHQPAVRARASADPAAHYPESLPFRIAPDGIL